MYMQQGIMGSHASPDLWISAEKNPRSAELRRTFCDVEFRRKKKISRNPRENHWISRSPLHILWCWVPPNHIGLNTKFRWFFSAEVRYTICVVEFRRRTKSVKKNKCNRFGGTGSQEFRRKKNSRSQDVSCPIIVRNGKKVHKVCKISCWKI